MTSPSATLYCFPPVSMIAYITLEDYQTPRFHVNDARRLPPALTAPRAVGYVLSRPVMEEKPLTSPAWYRFRSAVFALIYAAGFLGGWALAGLHYVPAYAALGVRLGNDSPGMLLGVACIATLGALAIRAWGASYLTAAVVWNPDALDRSLIVAGPFRFTRNPLYLGNALLAIGFGLLAPLPGAAFILIANAVFIAALIRHEEALMLRRYGEDFRAYCSIVPRFFPRFAPAPSNSELRPLFVQGMLSELFTTCICAGLFIWILAPAYGWVAFIVLYLAGAFTQRAVDRALQAGVAAPHK